MHSRNQFFSYAGMVMCMSEKPSNWKYRVYDCKNITENTFRTERRRPLKKGLTLVKNREEMVQLSFYTGLNYVTVAILELTSYVSHYYVRLSCRGEIVSNGR